jgi:hypothetical protein
MRNRFLRAACGDDQGPAHQCIHLQVASEAKGRIAPTIEPGEFLANVAWITECRRHEPAVPQEKAHCLRQLTFKLKK